MASRTRLSAIAVAAFFGVCAAAPAEAGINRAFISGAGVNSVTCGAVATPCKTLQYVHDNIINWSGEIVITGPGEYGPVTITKALSIANQGSGVASLTQPLTGQNAIWIKAAAGDSVSLTGLTLEGLGAAASGVFYQSGASLRMVDCVVRRFKNVAVYAAPSGAGKVIMTNNTLADSGGGVLLAPFQSFSAAISGLKVANNGNGLELSGRNAPTGTSIYAIATDNIGSGNASAFLSTSIAGKAIPTLALDRAFASGNGFGVTANRGNIRLSNSIIDGNGYGVSISSGVVFSAKNNSVVDNGSKVVGGTLTVVAPD